MSKSGETVERVLLNPKNGKLVVGIRLQFMDRYAEEEIGAFDGKYTLKLAPMVPDAWAIDNQEGIWIVVGSEHVKDLVDLGEL